MTQYGPILQPASICAEYADGTITRGEVEVERLPRYGFLSFAVPDGDFERVHWRV